MLIFSEITWAEYGILGLIVMALGTVIYRTGAYVLRRLFDEEKGLAVKFLDEHVQTMKKLSHNGDGMADSMKQVASNTAKSAQLNQETNEVVKMNGDIMANVAKHAAEANAVGRSTNDIVKANGEIMENILRENTDPNSHLSTQRTNEAVSILMAAIFRLSKKMEIDISDLQTALHESLKEVKPARRNPE